MMASKELDIEFLDPLLDVAKVLNNIGGGTSPDEMQCRKVKRHALPKIYSANDY